MNHEFKKLREFVDHMNSTNQTTHKLNVLRKWSSDAFIMKVLYATYNPFYQYHITPETCEKFYTTDLGHDKLYASIWQLLADLRDRNITGHDAIQSVNNFVFQYEEYKDLIYKIIGKDLEIRAGETLINKVTPGFIPSFDVALATDFEKVNPDVSDGTWFSSRKMDGVRCLAVINENGKCSLWSRQGKEFETLNNVIKDIQSLGLVNTVLDGEICMVDKNGLDDFSGIMKEIRKKDHTIQNPRFLMFDCLTMDEFKNKVGNTSLYNRLSTLNTLIPVGKYPTLSVLKQTLIETSEQLNNLLEDADSKGWEGLILRKNVGYEGKRGKNMLKCKTFKDAEYVVNSIETGPFRVIENGVETTIELMTNINITHKGNKVSVGSGWSLDERKHYYNHPNDIVGKVVTVKYFQESINKNGEYSLRFPTKKFVHGSKRTM